MKSDQVGIAVKDLKEAIDMYKKIVENPKVKAEEVPSEKARVAMISVGGTRIELLEALT